MKNVAGFDGSVPGAANAEYLIIPTGPVTETPFPSLYIASTIKSPSLAGNPLASNIPNAISWALYFVDTTALAAVAFAAAVPAVASYTFANSWNSFARLAGIILLLESNATVFPASKT